MTVNVPNNHWQQRHLHTIYIFKQQHVTKYKNIVYYKPSLKTAQESNGRESMMFLAEDN